MKRLRKWVFWMKRYDDALRDLRRARQELDDQRRRADRYEELFRRATDVIRLERHLLTFEPTVDINENMIRIRLSIREQAVAGAVPLYPARRCDATELAEALYLIEEAAWGRVERHVREDLRRALADVPRLVGLLGDR